MMKTKDVAGRSPDENPENPSVLMARAQATLSDAQRNIDGRRRRRDIHRNVSIASGAFTIVSLAFVCLFDREHVGGTIGDREIVVMTMTIMGMAILFLSLMGHRQTSSSICRLEAVSKTLKERIEEGRSLGASEPSADDLETGRARN